MPIAKKNDIPNDFLEQMRTNLKKESESEIEVANKTTSSQISTAVNTSVENHKKDKYADVMNVRLSHGRRNEIKAFCSSCGISITQYIESSFEYLSKEVASGRIVISKGGITNLSV